MEVRIVERGKEGLARFSILNDKEEYYHLDTRSFSSSQDRWATCMTEGTAKIIINRQRWELKSTETSMTDYFHEMQEVNGTSMAYTLTAEYFGITEEEVVYVINEGK